MTPSAIYSVLLTRTLALGACAPESDASICNCDHRCLSSPLPAVILQTSEKYYPLLRTSGSGT
jgi:hypothetical protein